MSPDRCAGGGDLEWGPRTGPSRCTTRIRASPKRRPPRTSVTPGPLAFNPDGTRIATARRGWVTRLWDTSTGRMTAQCRGHTQGAQRRIPPGWPAPRDDVGGWDRPPVGSCDGPRGRVALRSTRVRSSPRHTAPTGVGRLRRHGSDPSGCGRRPTGTTSRSCTGTPGS